MTSRTLAYFAVKAMPRDEILVDRDDFAPAPDHRLDLLALRFAGTRARRRGWSTPPGRIRGSHRSGSRTSRPACFRRAAVGLAVDPAHLGSGSLYGARPRLAYCRTWMANLATTNPAVRLGVSALPPRPDESRRFGIKHDSSMLTTTSSPRGRVPRGRRSGRSLVRWCYASRCGRRGCE